MTAREQIRRAEIEAGQRESSWRKQSATGTIKTAADVTKALKDEPNIREEDIQRETKQVLSDLGYVVLETTHRVRRTRCPGCGSEFVPRYRNRITGEFSDTGYGSTPGVPDLLVIGRDWPPLTILGIEMKGPKTALSEAQKSLAGAKMIVVCRSAADAVRAVQDFEESLR